MASTLVESEVHDKEPALAILAENRRWLLHHANEVLHDMELPNGDCLPAIRELVGLSYPQMIAAAQKANFRHTLWYIGEQVAEMFEAVAHRSPKLAALPADQGPGWEEITRLWQK